MKKIITILLIVLMLLPMASCGSKRPDDEEILNSIRMEHFGRDMVITDFQILLSFSEDKEYSATVSFNEQKKYSETEYEFYVYFTRYDQGWAMDDYDCTVLGTRMTYVPDDEFMSEMVKEVLPDAQINTDNFYVGDDYFTYENKYSEDYKYCTAEVVEEYRWDYDSNYDEWIPETLSDTYAYTDKNELYTPKDIDLSGDYVYEYSYATFTTAKRTITVSIENFSWEEFDAEWGDYDFSFDGYSGHFVNSSEPPYSGAFDIYGNECVFVSEDNEHKMEFDFGEDDITVYIYEVNKKATGGTYDDLGFSFDIK